MLVVVSVGHKKATHCFNRQTTQRAGTFLYLKSVPLYRRITGIKKPAMYMRELSPPELFDKHKVQLFFILSNFSFAIGLKYLMVLVVKN